MIAAVVAMAPSGGGFEQTCDQCRHDPEKRAQWGCDAPAAEPVFYLEPCPVCEWKDPECEHCKGTNRLPVFRCPNVLATSREFDCLAAAARVEHGVLPDAGGWHDQPRTFVQAFPLAMREIARWREQHEELARREAELRSKKRGR